jgi:hypothetical protein
MKGLALELNVLARESESETLRLLRGAALQALTGLVLGTPVDTGRARGNWLVGINQPVDVEAGVEDKAGGLTITRGQLKFLRVKLGDDIWLANNVPYILRLAGGWSEQASEGWIDRVLAEVDRWIEEEGDEFLEKTRTEL